MLTAAIAALAGPPVSPGNRIEKTKAHFGLGPAQKNIGDGGTPQNTDSNSRSKPPRHSHNIFLAGATKRFASKASRKGKMMLIG
jgi:hypothetical protein